MRRIEARRVAEVLSARLPIDRLPSDADETPIRCIRQSYLENCCYRPSKAWGLTGLG